jgi:serine/threonine-protein kinase
MGEGAAALLTGLPEVGDVIAGKYTIERVLAVGGMGAVMAAHDMALDRRVAVKFLLPKALESPEIRERFFREARAAVSIRSEHVVDVYEVGVSSPDTPYIVMEYLPGRDLHKLLENRAPLPVPEAIDFVLQSCEALAEAHTLGIVHRDVKPSNLFVTHRPDGTPFVKVLDFGISKTMARLEEHSKSLTQSSVALGSPLYMSPEQVRNSKVVDSRTDIWSLGVVLFELLAKRLPFDGETIPSLAAAIASDAPLSLRSLRPDVEPKLEAIILRCLEKDPARRYQKISSLARDLAEFAEPGPRALLFERIEQPGAISPLAFESTTKRQLPLAERETAAEFGPSGIATVGAHTTAGLGTTRRFQERQRWSLGLIAGGCALVFGVGSFFVFRAGSTIEPVKEATASLASASTFPDATPLATLEPPAPEGPIAAAPTASAAVSATSSTPAPRPAPVRAPSPSKRGWGSRSTNATPKTPTTKAGSGGIPPALVGPR